MEKILKENTYIYLNYFAVLETNTTLYINYASIFFFLKKASFSEFSTSMCTYAFIYISSCSRRRT